MTEEQTTIEVGNDELLGAVADFRSQGYRLVQICCTALADSTEINYSFDKDYRFMNLRLTVRPGEEIQSISIIYWSAFVYENEMSELFGVRIRNIVVDYRGQFYRTAVATPFITPRADAANDTEKE